MIEHVLRGIQGYVMVGMMRDLTRRVLDGMDKSRRHLNSLRKAVALSQDFSTCLAVKEWLFMLRPRIFVVAFLWR